MTVTYLKATRIDVQFRTPSDKKDLEVFMQENQITQVVGMNVNDTEKRLIAFFKNKDAKKIIKFINN